MRKISAHFYLRPDGTFGKRPILHLDDTGRIEMVRELGDAFQEEPGLEYFPGILVPGFVASCAHKEPSDRMKRLARINGVLRFQCGDDRLADLNYWEAWKNIKDLDQEQVSIRTLAHYLLTHTKKAAQLLGIAEWGALEKGAQPGVLVLQNIDLRDFCITAHSSFKIIQK
ncbi:MULTISPECIES: hypothetical protein [unclassified Carboxylicivirga]|uniref:hypothetical protein n=1 Tax=Carboxylicivirga TaxID=1628153 RepID=UPI003D32D186